MDTEELEQTWHDYKQTGDPQRRDALVAHHLPQVRAIATRLLRTLPRSVALDDLVSAGTVGLLRAVDAFEPERGVAFAAYCTARVRGAILDELRAQDWVPRSARDRVQRLDHATRELALRLGRPPLDSELAGELELTPERVRALQQEAAAMALARAGKQDDPDASTGCEHLAANDRTDPARALRDRDLLAFLIDRLTERERTVLTMRYFGDCSLREIADRMGFTLSRISQIHANATARMRAHAAHLGEPR
ncbi:MAG: FliA/WhiG family RNA polymerase sigma factor [Planctomycetes bacterium]|nr:FliA/WhiG family RNA polymerase sigma factor [Planctomycetota bacterium]MCB9889996.1 FliA/WhiG family RNA polymerase sigma factor [Planctomycetota bacterium]